MPKLARCVRQAGWLYQYQASLPGSQSARLPAPATSMVVMVHLIEFGRMSLHFAVRVMSMQEGEGEKVVVVVVTLALYALAPGLTDFGWNLWI